MTSKEHTNSVRDFKAGDGVRFAAGRVIPAEEILFRFSRSGGPGGQNVNKVATRVEVLFNPGDSRAFSGEERERLLAVLADRIDRRGFLRVVSDASRSQWENRILAVGALSAILDAAMRPRKKRRATKATAGSRLRRREGKQRQSAKKRLRGPGRNVDFD